MTGNLRFPWLNPIFLKWENQLTLNSFSQNFEPMKVDSVKSVTLNSTLTFTSHIHELVVKAEWSASMIFRCFNSRYVPSLINAF